jgi:hypothetical protein
MLRKALFISLITLLHACANLPESFVPLKWQDQRGDRGVQVMQRDLAWCIESVETRRSLLEACMSERGWVMAK